MPPIDAQSFGTSLRSNLPALFEALWLGSAPTLEQHVVLEHWNEHEVVTLPN